MKISKFLHSCVLIEDNGKGLLIDPGTFSFIENRITPDIFKNINVVVFTHAHSDHFDKRILEAIIKNNVEVKIVSNSDVLNLIKGFANTILLEDRKQNVEGFEIEGFFAEHEDVGYPCPKNTAYIINGLILHPGDSLKPIILEHKTKILAVPVAGPWLTRVYAMNFVGQFKPGIIFPIHDAYIKDFFIEFDYGAWQNAVTKQGIDFKALKEPGESFEI